jgi:hypothetical protein
VLRIGEAAPLRIDLPQVGILRRDITSQRTAAPSKYYF